MGEFEKTENDGIRFDKKIDAGKAKKPAAVTEIVSSTARAVGSIADKGRVIPKGHKGKDRIEPRYDM